MSRLPDGAPEGGYRHRAYAASLAEFGDPCLLPASGGWVLERGIGDGAARDAMGCYPLFACRDWGGLAEDLRAVGQRWVSLALVADPFGADERVLRQAFAEQVAPFKEHFVVDLDRPRDAVVSSHHRREVRRAERCVHVEAYPDPPGLLDVWVELYGSLVERHRIGGLRAFSRGAFAAALQVPGIVFLAATAGGQTVGAHLWYVQDGVAYSHLAACSPAGYRLGAAYALHWFALDYFRGRVHWLDLGGAAGAAAAGGNAGGLADFKRGWATARRMAYFCSRIFDAPRYHALVRDRGVSPNGYFPIYRQGELL